MKSKREEALQKRLAQIQVQHKYLEQLVGYHTHRLKATEFDVGFAQGMLLAHAVATNKYFEDPNCKSCKDGSRPTKAEKGKPQEEKEAVVLVEEQFDG